MGMEYSGKLTLNIGWKVKGQLMVIWMSPEDFISVDLGQGKMVKILPSCSLEVTLGVTGIQSP